MGKYTVEQVEFLRARAQLTYEEAMELLTQYDGDLTQCMLDLEKRGMLREDSPYQAYDASEEDAQGSFKSENTNRLLRRLLHARLRVSNKDRMICDVPLPYGVGAAVIAPHLLIITAGLMVVFGCNVSFNGDQKEA